MFPHGTMPGWRKDVPDEAFSKTFKEHRFFSQKGSSRNPVVTAPL
ncbi:MULTISPECIES: hypothetical protein [Novacetimonas]|uniref:Uncharacterized protein n=1 Tax=Novacetimonas hansenii ATCC 23769 TaxID=714995 RepID=D5QC77_NOVHA|nr:hypothetical protein [Novacetimonas hansenii]EFG85273.1 hypothetical protein GXY_03638 [Novacetimonas hansenii ATCC 23769]